MSNKNYLRFRYWDVLSTLLICICWSGISGYVVVVKGAIGIDNINILEAVGTMIALLGVKYGFSLSSKIKLSTIMLIDTVAETIFLSIFTYLVYTDNIIVGVSIFCVMILNRFLRPFKKEKLRYIEDHNLTNIKYKKILQEIRKKDSYNETVGCVIGMSISLICINTLAIDTKLFVLFMISLSIASNVLNYYKFIRYLK